MHYGTKIKMVRLEDKLQRKITPNFLFKMQALLIKRDTGVYSNRAKFIFHFYLEWVLVIKSNVCNVCLMF